MITRFTMTTISTRNTRITRIARLVSISLLVLAAVGCTSTSKRAPSETVVLEGSRIIACCCGTPCPCRLNYPPMHKHGCDYVTAVHIDKGHIGNVRMDGVEWLVAGRTFGDPENNWIYVYLDETATAAQRKALEGFMQDGLAALGDKAPYLAGKQLGMRETRIDWTVSADGRSWDTVIPGVLELRTKSIVVPGQDAPVRSEGIFDDFGNAFVHADCVKHTYRDEVIGQHWELSGRQCNQAPFVLTSAEIEEGGVGWGCWSAHKDLGTTQKYTEQLIGHD